MNGLLSFRDKCKDFYREYGVYLGPVLKFALAMGIFTSISVWMGYMPLLSNILVLVILAAICAILPMQGMVVITVVILVLQCYSLNPGAGAVAAVLYLLLAILYFRFVPQDSIALALMPAACFLKMTAAVPVGLGLKRGMSSVLTAVISLISVYFLRSLKLVEALKSTGDDSLVNVVKTMTMNLIRNEEMILQIIACVVALLLAALIRKNVTTYTWLFASLAGCGSYLVICLAGGMVLNVQTDIPMLLLGTAGSFLICLVLGFFVFSVDYQKSQKLQFEDDDYVYFVKAVPKRKAERN